MIVLDMESHFPFGKHKDEKVKDVAVKDPGYIIWIIENLDDVEFSYDVIEEAAFNVDNSFNR